MRKKILLNYYAVTVEVHTQLINALSNIERVKSYKKPPFN